MNAIVTFARNLLMKTSALLKPATVTADNQFIPIPETVLPGGHIVPAFRVQQYHHSVMKDGVPAVRVSYHDAIVAAQIGDGAQLIRESQALAIAYNIAAKDENWTGGKVGAGKLYQGFRNAEWRRGAQPRDFTPSDADERRWHVLPGGHRIYDFAGHLYTWVFDDVQGDERGLIAKPFAKDSPSIVIPYPTEDKGQGWTPRAGADWSGNALIRGGCWRSESRAGVFRLVSDWPGDGGGDVGFRSTK